MLNNDWLKSLRCFANRRPTRRRSAARIQARRANTETLQVRTLLSSNPVMAAAPESHHAEAASTTEHVQHAHPAAMALISADQATNTVVASGNWSDPSVWENATPPTDGARIVIPAGMTLTVDSVIPHEFKTIGIHGTLSFATDIDTELRVDTIISAPHGRFEMGTAADPIAAGVTAKVVFVDDGVIDTNWDPEQLSRGAVLQGPTEIHGAETTHRVTLANHPAAGATTLQLSSVPAGWNAGDEIVITGTQGSTSDEVRTIAAIDGTTVTLNQALALDHIAPRADLNVYVANTTRNVELTSENPATAHRGHVMFMHTNNASVKNAAFTQLGRTDKKVPLDDFNFEFPEDAVGNRTSAGVVFTATPGARTNVRGRYPVHFHRGGTDPTSTRGAVDGSVVVGSPGYGLVNHSSNVDLTNNVSYDIHGSAFYTEAGDEIGSIVNNIAIRTVNPDFRLEENGEISVDLRADQQDFGVDGDAFWLSGHLVSMRDNVASGASGHGIIIWSDGLVEPDRGRSTVRTADIENGHLITGRDTIPTWWAPLAEITNNEASNATIGFRTRYLHSSVYLGDVGSPFHEPPDQAYIDTLSPTIDGLKVWGSRDGALLNYSERLSLKNADIVGIGAPYVRQDGTTDLGVGIDMYNENSRGPGVVENVTVSGFHMGILAPRHGEWQMSNVHLRNTTDLHIEQATIESRTLDMTNVTFGDLSGTAVAGNDGQRRNVVMKADEAGIQPFWFLMTDTVSLNGQGLYFNEQAASHVPLTEDLREDSRAPVPTEFVGLTNQQLEDTYGTSFGGEITPADAQTVSWLTGGVVGSLAEPGQTAPPLYEMRDADTFDVVSLGTLANFDPSQLPTGESDDEGDDEEEPDDGDESDEEDDEAGDDDGGDEGDDESDEDPGDGEDEDDAGDETEEDDEDSDEEPGDEDEDSEDEGDEDSGDEDGGDQDLASLVGQLRELSDAEVESLIEGLDVEDADERQEISAVLTEIRELSDEELSEVLTELSDEEREEVAELLTEVLGGSGDEDSDDGDEEPGDDEDSDDGDEEPGDDEDSDDGDEEPEDDEDTDEGDEEPGDHEDSDEGDEEAAGDENADEGDEPETPPADVVITLPDAAGGDLSVTLQSGEVVISQGGVEVSRQSVTGSNTLTINGSSHADSITLDLTDASHTSLETITVNGGDGDDSITLTGIANEFRQRVLTIRGEGGNDNIEVARGVKARITLTGDDGNDTLLGSHGMDTIRGGLGNDRLDGRSGRDHVWGDGGNDRIFGRGGKDVLFGGSGDDVLNGNHGHDVIRGDAGNDRLRGHVGNDQLFGGAGNDTLDGAEGSDTLNGNAGNDVLKGGLHRDALSGGAGNDRIWGERGNDQIVAGSGNDTALGGQGRDLVLGGSGNDEVDGQKTSNDTVSGGDGDDIVRGFAYEIDEAFTFSAKWIDAI